MWYITGRLLTFLFYFPTDSLQKYVSDLLDIDFEEILPHLMEKDLVPMNHLNYINDLSQPAANRKRRLVYQVILRLSEANIEAFLECLSKCHTIVHEQLYEKITSER